jgi:hypothetical protein
MQWAMLKQNIVIMSLYHCKKNVKMTLIKMCLNETYKVRKGKYLSTAFHI